MSLQATTDHKGMMPLEIFHGHHLKVNNTWSNSLWKKECEKHRSGISASYFEVLTMSHVTYFVVEPKFLVLKL